MGILLEFLPDIYKCILQLIFFTNGLFVVFPNYCIGGSVQRNLIAYCAQCNAYFVRRKKTSAQFLRSCAKRRGFTIPTQQDSPAMGRGWVELFWLVAAGSASRMASMGSVWEEEDEVLVSDDVTDSKSSSLLIAAFSSRAMSLRFYIMDSKVGEKIIILIHIQKLSVWLDFLVDEWGGSLFSYLLYYQLHS